PPPAPPPYTPLLRSPSPPVPPPPLPLLPPLPPLPASGLPTPSESKSPSEQAVIPNTIASAHPAIHVGFDGRTGRDMESPFHLGIDRKRTRLNSSHVK